MATILYRIFKGEIQTVRIQTERVAACLSVGYVADRTELEAQMEKDKKEKADKTENEKPEKIEKDKTEKDVKENKEKTPDAVQIEKPQTEATETQSSAKKRGRPKKAE